MTDLNQQELTSGEAVDFAIDSVLYRLRTATIGQVQSFNEAQNTVTVQPCIMRKQRGGGAQPVPVLQDIPVLFYGAGGYVVTFKPQAGDYCVLMASDRSIARWKQSGGIVDPAIRRRHDLSDSVAYFGLNEFSGTYQALRSGMDIRTRDGSTSFHVEDGKQTLTVGGTEVATFEPALITMKVPVVYQVGGATVSTIGAAGVGYQVPVTGPSATFGGISSESHTHSGVQSGTSNTGAPQ